MPEAPLSVSPPSTPGSDLLRAVMEGVTYSLKDCLSIFEELSIHTVSMMACGGGAHPLWRQMLADVFGCTVSTGASAEGGALGAALLAAVGAGMYGSVPDACDAAVRIKHIQQPIAENVSQYEKMYQLYTRLYPQLKNFYAELDSLV